MNHTTLSGYNLNLKTDVNPTNIGFVKPEHRLLKVLNTFMCKSVYFCLYLFGTVSVPNIQKYIHVRKGERCAPPMDSW